MESKDINITYETLYEILKREKDMTDLQKLDSNFFNEFVIYINDKTKLLEKDDSIFSYDEKKKVERQIDNAKRLIKDIYERREKKAIQVALIKSRTKSNVMDTSTFLDHEKKFYEQIVKILDVFRGSIVDKIMSGDTPLDIKTEIQETQQKQEPKKEEKKQITKLVRFMHAVPKFVGKELEEYGPYEEEDVANLPIEIAEILISKERVEEIKES